MELELILVALSALLAPAAAVPTGTSYISYSDYPAASARAGEQGMVQFALDISKSGKVTRCSILKSSGYDRLDRRTCKIMRERAHFRPARDASGQPIRDRVVSKMTWALSE